MFDDEIVRDICGEKLQERGCENDFNTFWFFLRARKKRSENEAVIIALHIIFSYAFNYSSLMDIKYPRS